MPQDQSTKDIYPVAIIGGGPIGLTCSILLSLRNIRHILFERHASTSIHPKACGINQRTTEIFRIMGIEDEVYGHAAPPEVAGRTAWYTSLGPGGREINTRDAWGGGQYAEEYKRYSPSKYCILPQIRLEPILKRRAMELNPEGIRYNCEVLEAENIDDHASVTVKTRSTEQVSVFLASYVLVADGGRMFTKHLGVKWCGEAGLFDMVTAHFRAPLRSLHPDPSNFITWFTNPEMGGSTRTGYLYQTGPWPEAMTMPEKEEWVFACGLTGADAVDFDEERMVARLKKTLGIADLNVDLLSFSHWTVNALYAERWRVGNLFLVGDAAHRIPPWGALGMNSGVQDAQNLVWKVCLALQDPTRYDRLLDTYQSERLNVGRRVGLSSLQNMRSHSNHIDNALGISYAQSKEENIRAAAEFFDSSSKNYLQKRAAVKAASRQLDTEFNAPGYEVGWFYPSADINSEGGETHHGQTRADGSLVHDVYVATTIPGHNLPHVWVEKDGQRRAIRDLLRLDQLTMFVQNMKYSQEYSDRLVAFAAIGPGYWQDISGNWSTVRGVGPEGGVLVRPDGIVAWRGSLSRIHGEDWSQLIDRILSVSR